MSHVPGDMAGLVAADLDEVPASVRSRALVPGQRAVRRLTTSEGVEVALPVAPLTARAWAWLFDTFIIAMLILALSVVAAIVAAMGLPGVAMSVVILGAFALRTFYFVIFETLHQGRTPGKRIFKLRVVDRHGRPLRVESIFVRNVTRDLETLLPLVVLVQPRALFPDAPGWGLFVSAAWLVLALFFPLFNRERLRIGDVLAGTFVAPTHRRVPLLDDPAIGALMRVRNERPVYTFAPEQLDMYGIFEVQLLEDALIQQPGRRAAGSDADLERLAAAIQRKIGWSPRPDDPTMRTWQFLHDFYAALRARHERRMLLGQRQPFKHPDRLPARAARPAMLAQRHSGVLEAVAAPAAAAPRPE